MIDSLLCDLRKFQSDKPKAAFAGYFILASALLFVLHLIEMQVGIDKRVHVDSTTYITRGHSECAIVLEQGFKHLPGRAFYCVVDKLGEVNTLILNASLVAFTSALMTFVVIQSKLTSLAVIATLGLIFAPYRLHLGIHLLKDSFIQFFICLSIFWRGGVIWLIPLTLFRPAAAIYYISLFRLRLSAAIVLFSLITVYVVSPGIFTLAVVMILNGNNLNFVFQSYDQVPTFQGNGLVGDLARALLWPFFLISGFFIILSPAMLFYPIALTGLFTIFALYLARNDCNWERVLLVYIGCGIIAYAAPGFTGYTRYAYPLATIGMVAALVGDRPWSLLEAFGPRRSSGPR